jgi:DNA invertase Pin-like site-specific DNA recombinase
MTQNTPAAQYVRMSTDSQHLSIALQTEANAAYAEKGGFEIIRTYEDPGISGLTFDKRPGLQALIADAASHRAPFQAILVYDVSRWGRFQDPDEAAHYEFLCRSAGLAVHYTTESFPNDATAATSLLKQLKRLMAAEFSRDLSAKLQKVHAHLSQEGWHAGGPTPYGFSRQEVLANGGLGRLLRTGERKAFASSRVRLFPSEESKVVQRIFRQFTIENRTMILPRKSGRG